MGEALQMALSKSAIRNIEVGSSRLWHRSLQPISFFHQSHPVMARMPVLHRIICGGIPSSLQLRQIGIFIRLNPYITEISLDLSDDFVEEITPDGPEGLGILIRAIVGTLRSSIQAPLSEVDCPYQFCLRTICLSTFSMDEDAEEGLSFMLNHCPLETLLLRNVAIFGNLSVFFNAWRKPQALSCLRHLVLETDTIDQHAIDFPALTDFLIELGKLPHKFESLELRGGWKLLNMEYANVRSLRASTILQGLRTLIWESCAAKWCHDCFLTRATRTQMSIFAYIASCCSNIVMLGLPGFFTSSISDFNTLYLLRSIPRLAKLKHLHIQQTDRFMRLWALIARSPPLAPRAPTADVADDVTIWVKNSPRAMPSLDDDFFRVVARAIAILSLQRSKKCQPLRMSEFPTVTFGMLKCQTHVWESRFAVSPGLTTSSATVQEALKRFETSKARPSVPLSMRFNAVSFVSATGLQPQPF